MKRQAYIKKGMGIPSKPVLGTSKQPGSGTHPDSATRRKSTSGGAWFLPRGTAIPVADKRVCPEVLADVHAYPALALLVVLESD
eukprot:scaffold18668_cov15-Tisochrysis_lutea.AAC.1